jgi:hypothetical protein
MISFRHYITQCSIRLITLSSSFDASGGKINIVFYFVGILFRTCGIQGLENSPDELCDNNLNIEAFRANTWPNKLHLNFSTVEKLTELEKANDNQVVKFITKLPKSLISKTSLCRANVT